MATTAVSENNDLVALLLNKPKNTGSITMKVGDKKVTIEFQAISSKEYDKLLETHPPTMDQRGEGATYNINTFAPALLSECAVSPKLTVKQATDLWNSPNWSRGDTQAMFSKAVEVNFTGANVPFSESD